MIFGLLLLAVEVILIPGFGFFGISAIAMLSAAIYLAFDHSVAAGVITLLISVTVTVASVVIFPRTRWGKKFVLVKRQHADDGFVGTQAGLDELLGRTGETISALRPAGIVSVDGRRIDAVSEAEFIKARTLVKITKVEGNRVVVEPLPETGAEVVQS